MKTSPFRRHVARRRPQPIAVLAAVAFAAASLTAAPTRADQFAVEMPAKSCQAFFEFRGLDGQRDAFEQTAAYRSMVRSGFAKVVDSYLTNNLIKTIDNDDDRDMVMQYDAAAEEALNWLVANGAAGAVYAFTEDGDIDIAPVLILPRADEAIGFLNSLATYPESEISLEPADDGLYKLNVDRESIDVARAGDLLLIGDDDDLKRLVSMVAENGPDVTTHELWPSDAGDAVSVGFGDLSGVQYLAGEKRVPSGPKSPDGPTIRELMSVIGYDTLKAASTVHRIDGNAIRCVGTIQRNDRESAVADAKLSGSMTLDDLPPLPADTYGFSATRVDLNEIVPLVRDNLFALMEKYPDAGSRSSREEFDAGYNELVEELRFDPAAELVPALGSIVGVFDQPGGGPIFIPTTVYASVRDRAKLREIANKLADLVEQENRQAIVSRNQGDGYDRLTISVQNTPIVLDLGLSDEWAIISGNTLAVDAFFSRAGDDSAERWTASDDLLERNPALGGEFLSMTYVDPAATWQRGSMYLSMGLPLASQAVGRPLPPPQLPLSAMTKEMFPNVLVVQGGEDGVRLESTASAPAFPGAASVTLGPLLAPAILAPAIGTAIDASERAERRIRNAQEAELFEERIDEPVEDPAAEPVR